MEGHKSLHLVDVITSLAFPIVGFILALVSIIWVLVADANNIAYLLVSLIPSVIGLIFGVIYFVGRLSKKEKIFKVLPIIYNALLAVLDFVSAIVLFFISLIVGLFGAVVTAIAQGAGGNSGDGSSSSDIVNSLFNLFAPFALVFIVIGIISIACVVLSIISLAKKNRVCGIISGELSLITRTVEAGMFITFMLYLACEAQSQANMLPYLIMAFTIVLTLFPLINLGSIQTAFNQRKYSSIDSIERILFILAFIPIVILNLVPNYFVLISNSTKSYISISIGTLLINIFYVFALAFYLVSKYVKKVFFLELLGALVGIGGLSLIIVLIQNTHGEVLSVYFLSQIIFLLINGVALFVLQLLKAIKKIEVRQIEETYDIPDKEIKEVLDGEN